MKKNYSIACLLQVLVIIIFSFLIPDMAKSQDLTEEQKQERCQNNKNHIAELEEQLRIINADLSAFMGKKEMDYVREQLAFVKKLKTKFAQDKQPWATTSWDPKRITKISADYNFNMDDCLEGSITSMAQPCLTELEKLIAKKIDKALSLERPELINKKTETDKQLAVYRNNLIALRCDQSSGKAANISGTWTYATEWVYTIAQNGSNFTWYLAKIKQNAKGTINGKSVSATWFYQDGSVNGSATGTVTVDASGRAIQIDWSNGVVFKRN